MDRMLDFLSSLFNCYLAAPKPTLGLTDLMLITVFVNFFKPKVTENFVTVVGLSPGVKLVSFDLATTFPFLHSVSLSH